MAILLVISHPRSGTHFLIDSIVRNFKNTKFPRIRPSFASVENLFLFHDSKVSEMFHNYVFNDMGEEIRIVKTHILPDEFEAALGNGRYFSNIKDKRIVEYLYNEAQKIYISRDVKDVIISWYYYHKNGAGLHNAMKLRIQEATISEFMRSPNYHIMPCRSFSDFDQNLIRYWKYHNEQWEGKDVIKVRYEGLKNTFVQTIRYIAKELGKENSLIEDITKPPFLKQSDNFLIKRIQYRIKRMLGVTAVSPRKGVIGDHKSHFSPDDYRFIENELRA